MEADRKMLSIYIIFIAVFDAGTTNSCTSNISSCSDCFLACNFLSVVVTLSLSVPMFLYKVLQKPVFWTTLNNEYQSIMKIKHKIPSRQP